MRGRVGMAAALAALVIAGCGGGSGGKSPPAKSGLPAFKTGFAQSQREFRQLGQDISSDIRAAAPKSDTALAREFAALATRGHQAATRLGSLNPPAHFQAPLHRLVTGLDGVAGDLQRISSAAKRNDASAAKSASVALLKDAATVKSLDTSLSKSLGLALP